MDRIRLYFIALAVIVFSLFLGQEAPCAGEGKGNNVSDGQASKELVVSTVVKLFAKGYIAVTDIDKAKKNNIAKLEKMDDQEFRQKYTAIYGDMKGLPQDVKDTYGIDEKMDRYLAIKKIQSASKKDLYAVIDSIPDPFIVKHFEVYLVEKGVDLKKSPSTREAVLFWNNIRKKLAGE
ncbi:MAG: hypothetical protein C0392_00805 [Syntrophus sp. (in: bacteria)]|nr:hypothetical protein [Syntrophus sp. (in: bacteria)]